MRYLKKENHLSHRVVCKFHNFISCNQWLSLGKCKLGINRWPDPAPGGILGFSITGTHTGDRPRNIWTKRLEKLSFGPFHNFKGVYWVIHFFLASFLHCVIWLKTSLGKDSSNAGPARGYLLLYQCRVVSPPGKRVVYWRYLPLSTLLNFTWYASSCKYVTITVMKHVCGIRSNFCSLKPVL